jgi:excinuclease ABC subunit A
VHHEWFSDLHNHLTDKENKISVHILKEINERLNFLINVGLDYLNLSRSSGTLSGGESSKNKISFTNWLWINWSSICLG